jgi:hypothetical protein
MHARWPSRLAHGVRRFASRVKLIKCAPEQPQPALGSAAQLREQVQALKLQVRLTRLEPTPPAHAYPKPNSIASHQGWLGSFLWYRPGSASAGFGWLKKPISPDFSGQSRVYCRPRPAVPSALHHMARNKRGYSSPSQVRTLGERLAASQPEHAAHGCQPESALEQQAIVFVASLCAWAIVLSVSSIYHRLT